MKPNNILTMILAMVTLCIASITSACALTATDPGGGGDKAKPTLAADLLNGVCLNTERGAVCYHPLLKQWTLKVPGSATSQPLTVIRQDTGTVTLSTPDGGQLVYRGGHIEWPTEPDRSGK